MGTFWSRVVLLSYFPCDLFRVEKVKQAWACHGDSVALWESVVSTGGPLRDHSLKSRGTDWGEEEIPRRNRKLECSRRGRRCAAPVPRLFLIFHISGSCGESCARFHYGGGGCWPCLSACARVNDRRPPYFPCISADRAPWRLGVARCRHTHCCQRRHYPHSIRISLVDNNVTYHIAMFMFDTH